MELIARKTGNMLVFKEMTKQGTINHTSLISQNEIIALLQLGSYGHNFDVSKYNYILLLLE